MWAGLWVHDPPRLPPVWDPDGLLTARTRRILEEWLRNLSNPEARKRQSPWGR